MEALGSTKLNLLLNVVFNEEVGQDAAIYWSKEEGNLAGIIDQSDKMEQSEIDDYGRKAKQRIKDAYSWQFIADRYDSIFG